MARALMVRDARNALENTNIFAFAKEMGITVSDAEAVKSFVSQSEVPEDSFVFLEPVIIDDVALATGNIRR